MKDFEFYAPTNVIFEKDGEKRVGTVIRGYGYKKALLVYGGGSIKRTGLYDKVISSLDKAGVGHAELGGVEPNPKVSLAREGVRLCREEGCDILLAVGGGSVIDTAKGIAIAAPGEADIWDYWSKKINPGNALPVGVILTISAAGSETSNSAVLTNEELNLKRGLNCDQNRPLFAIMNPELTYTLPPFQTACGIVDIMMHTLERYITKKDDFELTDRIDEALLKSVVHYGRAVMRDPKDYDARAGLMWAGSLSHNGLTGCGRDFFFFSHQLGHEISTRFGAAHGASLSIMFPAYMKYFYKYNVPRFCQFAVRVFGCTMNYSNPEKTALEGIRCVEEYFRFLGTPTRLSDIGGCEADAETLADMCSQHGTRTIESYKVCGRAEMLELYKLAL